MLRLTGAPFVPELGTYDPSAELGRKSFGRKGNKVFIGAVSIGLPLSCSKSGREGIRRLL